MRVLFLQRQPCIRTLKYAVGLRAAVPGLHLSFAYQGSTLSGWYGAGDDAFDAWIPLGDDPEPVAAIRTAIERTRPDVVHSHNLPDILSVLAIDLLDGRVPVIHDVHDMQSLRRTPYRDGFPEPEDTLALERRAIEESAAVVAISDEMVEEIVARHRRPARTLVYANHVLARDLPQTELPRSWRGGPIRLAYQGSLGADGGHYDLRETFTRIVEAGAWLDVHPARPAPDYVALASPGLTVHEPLDPPTLMRVLPRYDVGWAGFNDALNRAHIDTALPNKLFEYLGCGLPVATLGHRALTRFVTAHGVGVSGTSVEDVIARLMEADLDALRGRAAELRADLTVEANIGRLVALYAEVAGVRTKSRLTHSRRSWEPAVRG
jgi:glycosyltransferase involved in cell wall biosynthesis